MSREITISLTLTETEWAEVYYAVDTKLKKVQDGDYGGSLPSWETELEIVLSKIKEAMYNKEVNF